MWAGGLDSRPRIEKVVGDAGAWLPQRRRRRLLVQVLEQRTGLARRHSPPREGQRALESREPVASAARLGWHGGAVEAINLCRKASSSVRAAPGQACSPEQRPSMPESCSGCRARCWPSRGRRARLERRARLLAATLAFHPREGGHTMPRSSRWARPPLRARRRRAGLADEVVHWLSAGCALRSRAWPSTPYRVGAPQRTSECAPCRGRRPRCRRHGACSCEQRPCSPPYRGCEAQVVLAVDKFSPSAFRRKASLLECQAC